jgi:type IV pilus assembly protein PilA
VTELLKMLRQRIQDDKGFTLIELMVVVLIIAILIAIAIPTFLGLRQRAQDRAAQSDLRNGLTAAKAYYTDDETFAGFVANGAGTNDGEGIEPSLEWVDGAGAAGQVGITNADAATVVLTTVSESNAQFCIADSETVGTVTGTGAGAAAANSFNACQLLADW